MTEEKKTHQWIVTCGESGWSQEPEEVEACTKAQAVTLFLVAHCPEASRKWLTALRKVTTCVKVKTSRLRKAPLLKEPCPLCHKEGIEKWDYPGHWEVCHITYRR